MLTALSITATKRLMRYRLFSDGNALEAITLPNAQLLTDMKHGPLRDLFNVKGLTQAQAIHRCQESRRIGTSILATQAFDPIAPIPAFAVEVGVDGEGAPTLIIGAFKFDISYTGLLDLFYRPKSIR